MHDDKALEVMVSELSPFVDAFLTDTFDTKTRASGATGKTHDWRVSRRLVELSDRPVILAAVTEAEQHFADFPGDRETSIGQAIESRALKPTPKRINKLFTTANLLGGGLLYGKHREPCPESLHIFQRWRLESEVEPSCPLWRPGEGATLYVCQQDWGSFIDSDFTEVNSTTCTMDNEGLAPSRPHVLYPRSLSSKRYEVLLAIELRGDTERRIGFPEVLPRTSSVTLRGVIPIAVISGATRRLSQLTRLMTPRSLAE